MIAWISKYALTSGIFSVEAEVCSTSPTMIHEQKAKMMSSFYHKPHWHNTKEEAIVQAEKMRKKKVASLEKQLNKIRKMTFGGNDG